MNSIWIISMLLQWAMIFVLSFLVLSLMRQLGEFSSSGVTVKQPDDLYPLFSELAEIEVPLVNGKTFNFGGTNQNVPCLIVFFSPTCGACTELPEAIAQFVKKFPATEFKILAVLKQIEADAVEKFIKDRSLTSIPVALDQDYPAHLNPGGAPYGVSIAMTGLVAARGKPKNLSHLLEMAQAARTMAEMVPDHSKRKHEWGESAPYWAPEQLGSRPKADA